MCEGPKIVQVSRMNFAAIQWSIASNQSASDVGLIYEVISIIIFVPEQKSNTRRCLAKDSQPKQTMQLGGQAARSFH